MQLLCNNLDTKTYTFHFDFPVAPLINELMFLPYENEGTACILANLLKNIPDWMCASPVTHAQ